MKSKLLIVVAWFLFLAGSWTLKASPGNSSSMFLNLPSIPAPIPSPPPGIIGDSSVCESEVATYEYPTSSLDDVFIWNVSNGSGTASGNRFTVNWGNAGPGTVSLVIKNNSGNVIHTENYPVMVYAKPYPFITASFSSTCKPRKGENIPRFGKDDDCFVACDSSVVTYTTPMHSGSTYTWTVLGAISYSVNVNSIQVYWGAPGNGLIVLTETNAKGCSNTIQKCVDIIESPEARFSSLPLPIDGVIRICKGQTVQFFDQSIGSPSSLLSDWSWNFGDGTTSSDQNPSHVYGQPGVYLATLYVRNECYCKDSVSIKVIVDDLDVPLIVCHATVCAGATGTYSTPSGCDNATYLWTVSGGVIIGPNNTPNVSVQWGNNGSGVLSLEISGCEKICSGKSTMLIPIIPPTVTIEGPDPACLFGYGLYSIPLMPGSTYNWTINNGLILSGQGSNQVEVQWFHGPSGSIDVTYFNPSLNCGGSASKTVNLSEPFTVSGPLTVCNQSSSSYTATSGSAFANASYVWTISDAAGNTLSSFSGSHIFTPTWSFGAGIYKITVENNSGEFCNSPQTFFVTVKALPPAVTSVNGNNLVCPGSTYTYSAASTASNTYLQWAVTNGSPATSIGNSISVTWGPSGPYQLSVSQVNMAAPNCASPAFVYNVGSKLPAGTPTINGPATTCKNSIRNYSSSLANADSYTWSITPATAGSVIGGQGSANITVQWNNTAGSATLNVQASTCGVNTSNNLAITLINILAPAISGPVSGCQGTAVSFSSSSTGSAYAWNFGNGITANGAGPHNVSYSSIGTFVVTLTVTDPNGCIGQATTTQTININPAPAAVITTPDPTTYCPNITVSTTMYITSLINPGSTIQWYRNGTAISGATSNSYTATIAGAYNAVITNSNSCSKTSNTIVITVLSSCTPNVCLPAPGSFISFTSVKTGDLTYLFTASISSNGRVTGWTFGDGGSAGAVNSVSHTYDEPGYYNVTAYGKVSKLGNPNDSCDVQYSQTIVVPIEAEFNYEISCGTTPNTYLLNFIDRSDFVSPHTISNWSWTFSGGSPSTSTAQNPTGISFSPGTYNVSLTITSTTGFTATYTMPVVVPSIPSLNIISPTASCQGNTVSFSSSVPATDVNAWLWDFGDGASSALPSPQRTYTTFSTPGTFTVTLSITDKFGCSRSTTKPITIYQNTVSATITASGPTTFCNGKNVQLTANPSGGVAAYSYLWSTVTTTQAITVSQSGNYYADITDSRGCRARSNTVSVVVNTMPRATISGDNEYCFQESTQLFAFQGSNYNYLWLRNGISTGITSPTYVTILPVGTYNIQVVITNPSSGCKDTSAVFPVLIRALPIPPSISSSPTPACEGNAITLSASSSVSPATFNWNNGDNGPVTTVYNAGFYIVTLTDQYGCQSKALTEVYEAPDFSNLMTGCYEFCDTGSVTLLGPIGTNYKYQWYMDGQPIPAPVGTAQNLIIPVQNAVYHLEVTTVNGCTATSGNIDVRFVSCKECEGEFFIKDVICVYKDKTTGLYYFTINVYNPFGPGATLSLNANDGVVYGLNPATLDHGLNTVTGYFKTIPSTKDLCLSGSIHFGKERCILRKACFELKECEEPGGCKIEHKLLRAVCLGKDVNGNYQYYFEYYIYWTGSDNSEIVAVNSPNGYVSSWSGNIVNNGPNVVSGIFTMTNNTNGEVCFTAYIFDPKTGRTCSFRNCVKVPRCTEPSRCEKLASLFDIGCKDKDVNGNQMYHITFDVLNSLGANVDVYIYSSQGSVSNQNPLNMGPGASLIDFDFTDLPPTDGQVCFTIIMHDPRSGKWCRQDLCFELPRCRRFFKNALGGNGSELQTDLNQALILAPNPARESVSIRYSFATTDAANQIIIADMYGRVLHQFSKLDQKGEISLSTLKMAPGAYIVNASGYQTQQSKRLIIIR